MLPDWNLMEVSPGFPGSYKIIELGNDTQLRVVPQSVFGPIDLNSLLRKQIGQCLLEYLWSVRSVRWKVGRSPVYIVVFLAFTKTRTQEQTSGTTTKTVLKADRYMIYVLQKSPL